ncbi:Uma2 family endonuclease [Pseudonocardia ailaonensis]|uniref:Uma2 family endonuclease n=1 Tax=Pseudonocardia ailaonensis TaxID=367279 RepID=A0ABN2NMZ1_9PSEU
MAQPMSGAMTLANFDALPEDNSVRYELQDGVVVMSARPNRPHQRALHRLISRIEDRLPAGWEVLGEFEVLVLDGSPATVRVPDIVVTRTTGNENRADAADVALAVEIISPGSRNIDLHLKPFEYGEAGIPQYWVVDLDPPAPSITVFTLDGEGYREQPAVAGELRATLELDGPVDLVIDVAALV